MPEAGFSSRRLLRLAPFQSDSGAYTLPYRLNSGAITSSPTEPRRCCLPNS
ncbi:Uncharacterised protein [Bordetella pertussis]|nr:Uncharacterised protein [Bordetella pertussis]CFP61713.1 Uncharacterised protein [Bordetella pertussis]CFW07852.1 Uncharacterised protein [Bordetella pertussis]CFW41199.1 Uncharacterised protein [Bordetella pertussis]CPL32333.1 Uncharacterised protein [Bordetella pertussis]